MENVGVLRTGANIGDLLSIAANELNLRSCTFTGNAIEDDVRWGRLRKEHEWVAIRIGSNTVGKVEDTTVTLCRGGILLEGNSEIKLNRNSCMLNEDFGIKLRHSAICVADNNKCNRNKLAGIWVSDQSRAELTNNRCEENLSTGIVFRNYATGIAEKNICNRNLLTGIRGAGKSKVKLIGNYCEDNKNGISFSGTTNGFAENNICNRNKRAGISVLSPSGQPEVLLTGNHCEENWSYGIFLNGYITGIAENNICSRNKMGKIDSVDKGSFFRFGLCIVL